MDIIRSHSRSEHVRSFTRVHPRVPKVNRVQTQSTRHSKRRHVLTHFDKFLTFILNSKSVHFLFVVVPFKIRRRISVCLTFKKDWIFTGLGNFLSKRGNDGSLFIWNIDKINKERNFILNSRRLKFKYLYKSIYVRWYFELIYKVPWSISRKNKKIMQV